MTGRMKIIMLAAAVLVGAYSVFGDRLPFTGGSRTSSIKLESYSEKPPVEGMVTMVAFGLESCLPCRMMSPILLKVKEEYEGRAAILYIDVAGDREAAERYGVRTVPTQIFYDDKGRRTHRHEGFLDEAGIKAMLEGLGVS